MSGRRQDSEAELCSPAWRTPAKGEAERSTREPDWAELYAELAAHEQAAPRRLRSVS